MAKKKTFNVGDKVRLTAKFLQSTGQYTGSEGRKVWTVLAVDTGKYGAPDMLTVDEPRSDMSYFTAEEIAAEPMLKWRRISAGNVLQVGKPDTTGL